MKTMKNIAVLTSGGDSPGMNACIRAVTRTALANNIHVWGIIGGFQGLIENEFIPLDYASVKNIIHRGGTILKTARSKDFFLPEKRKLGYDNLKAKSIDGLVVIGGDGTYAGARIFGEEFDFPIVGTPGTIDNDLVGTDYTIGYDTAINTVVSAVDKLRDTAESHNRMFVVEVMGKDAGLIALRSGIASGAEDILIPETVTYIDNLLEKLKKGWKRQKSSCIVIVAEGDDFGGATAVGKAVKDHFPEWDVRISILGHIQRGGSPTAMDRIYASRLGFEAVNALMDGKHGVAIGLTGGKITYTPFSQAIKHLNQVPEHLLKLANALSL
jgi:6-phosphofructokinase 1